VPELVREHALDLVRWQVLQQPFRDRDGRVLRVAPVANGFGCSDGIVYSRGAGT
jgi:hypothetical protein